MKTPDADHPITISNEPGRVQVLFEGHAIAVSEDVLVLREADYPPVRYFPRSDVAMAFLRKSDKVTHCPYKGEATYYTVMRDRQIIENAVWSYEAPYPAMSRITGRLAFYPEHFDFQVGAQSASDTEVADHERLETANAPAVGVDAPTSDVDDVVRHTDSGSGASQAEHWPPNVDMPDDEAWEGDEIRDEEGPEIVNRPYQGTGAI